MRAPRQRAHGRGQERGRGGSARRYPQSNCARRRPSSRPRRATVNRLAGWAGALVTSVAVVMSLFHLYAAVAGAWPLRDFPIIATQPLRYAHVAFVLMLSFLLFPLAARFRNRIRWWDIVAGIAGAAILIYAIEGGEEFTDRATMPTHARYRARHRLHRSPARGNAAHHGMDRSVHRALVHRLCARRALSAATMDASRLRHRSARRAPLHHARRHFRHSGRRVLHADHPVHDLWRVPASFRRRKILHRLLHGGHGAQAEQRRPHRGAGILPARRPFRVGRRHHRDDRRGCLSADETVGLREERRRRPARRRRSRRDHLAAGAGRRRLPDRRVPQDQLPRRDLDGSHPDRSLLSVPPVHGRARCQEVRRPSGCVRAAVDALADDAALRLPFHLADLDHRLHAVGLFADAVGVLVDGADFWPELPHARDRDRAEEAGARLVRRLDQRAHCRHHLRDRRHHRRRRHPDRPRPQVLLDRDRLCRRQPAADRDLYGADRLDRRVGGAGDRLLHHLRGHRRARHDQARGSRRRRPHVHLLLFGAVGSVAADRALAVCGRGDHRRRSLQDHAAGLEIHAAGVSGAVRVRARPARGRLAARSCRRTAAGSTSS